MTDMDHWGVIEKWSLPTDGYGDCEDYVLLKRKMLIDAGWPREALLITVVRDKKGEGHAVLTVKTDKGEFILDNQNENVVAWTETGYRFVKRQSQSDPNVWVSLGDGRPAVSTASARDTNGTINKDTTHEPGVTRPGHIPTPPRPRPDRARPALPQGLAATFCDGRKPRFYWALRRTILQLAAEPCRNMQLAAGKIRGICSSLFYPDFIFAALRKV